MARHATRFGLSIALTAFVCIVFAAAVGGQQKSASQSQTPALTALDYIEIQQLVSSYPYGLDGNTDGGESYANLFAPGAVFGRPRTEGHENLKALANTQPRGAKYVRHFITNHVIEPAPGGAIGKEYAVIIDIGENGNPSGIALGGRYDDEVREDGAGLEVQEPDVHAIACRCSAAAGRRRRTWRPWTAAVVRARETS